MRTQDLLPLTPNSPRLALLSSPGSPCPVALELKGLDGHIAPPSFPWAHFLYSKRRLKWAVYYPSSSPRVSCLQFPEVWLPFSLPGSLFVVSGRLPLPGSSSPSPLQEYMGCSHSKFPELLPFYLVVCLGTWAVLLPCHLTAL